MILIFALAALAATSDVPPGTVSSGAALHEAAPPAAQPQTASGPDTGLSGVRAMTPGDLGEVRGGQSTSSTVTGAFSNTALTAVNAGNSIVAGTVTSGGVTLGAKAFNGFDGLGNFVINTGNNNNLQGSLTVTIMMTPGLAK